MKRCGLLGEKLGHSYSPAIHAELADYEYRLYEVAPEKLGEFLTGGGFDGMNVTIPYKKAVIPYCAKLSPIAQKLQSVNVLVRREDGTLYGDNADAYGFAGMVRASGVQIDGKKTLVLGSGGASSTVCAVLEEMGARSVTIISRKGEDNYNNLDRHADAEVIVNTTPVGMYPNCGVSPVDLSLFPKLEGVLDIVYNPARTAFVLQAEKLGIPYMSGLYMLVAQAKRTAEVFENRDIPDSETERIWKKLSLEMQNIVLVGMPGSGKSTIAVRISESLGIPMLSKDSIKEVLFDDLGFHSRAEKVQLGTAAMHILYYAAAQLMKVGKPFILENNFEDASIPGIMALLETHHYTAVTVRLTGDPEVIYRRFAARDLSDTRHRGHVVNDCYPEPPGAPLETPTRKSYEQFLDDIAARGYTRFQANGPVLEVDVTDLSELDFPRLMGSLTGFVQRAVPGYPLRLPTRNAQSHRK